MIHSNRPALMLQGMAPTRRGFLAAAALAPTVPIIAKSPTSDSTAADETIYLTTFDPFHDPESHFCRCRGCCLERIASRRHPLIIAAAVAGYRAQAAVGVLDYFHATHCSGDKDEYCYVCGAAEFAIGHLELYQTCLQTGGPLVEQAEQECVRVMAAAADGRFPTFPKNKPQNDPAIEPALLAVFDYRDALRAILRCVSKWQENLACCMADVVLDGVERIADELRNCMVVTDAVRRRE